MRRHFPAAPWPTTLKVVSLLGTVALLSAGFAAYHGVPVSSGFTHFFGIGVALLPVAILMGSLAFIVSGYALEGTDLYVEHPFFSKQLSLAGLSKVWLAPTVCKGSIRIFGNGGLFSFSGLFYSKKLGRYRLFATDLSRAVVLVSPQRVVVVTPADPHAFIEHLRRRFPNADIALEPV